MKAPPSPHFRPVDLSGAFNINRHELPESLKPPKAFLEQHYGEAAFRGIPFALGTEGAPNAIILRDKPVTLPVPEGSRARYLVFLHVVEDRTQPETPDLLHDSSPGNASGGLVSTYTIQYADGSTSAHPIHRRFAIQQGNITWGASAYAAMPSKADAAFVSTNEAIQLGGSNPPPWGRGETRAGSGRDGGGNVWLYALPNPEPDKPLQSVSLAPGKEAAVVYGMSLTELEDHPLRGYHRRKLLLKLPEGAELNEIGEYTDLDIDLGVVISARRQLVYDHDAWSPESPDIQPTPSDNRVIVEYTAHPAARLHVAGPDGKSAVHELRDAQGTRAPVEIPAALRPVRIRVIDKQTRQPVPVRLHIHGQSGEYLPPKGYHRKVNKEWFEDIYAEFLNIHNQYAYVPGECIADLPLGTVYIEATRGYEVSPIRQSVEIQADTAELTFEVERVLDWRSRGWVTADTHVHFLTPTTAELEGGAEDVNVVNLLASQWGEMFSNVGDFDGKRTHGSVEAGGDGDFLVRVGSENRMQTLGHISLLGYNGALIHPLCTGGPSESALGDPQEVTMADWAEMCRRQGGLVVMPHAPSPQCERAADFVLGAVDAVELMSFNPYQLWQLNPYGLADWYQYQNLGYQLPLVGGTDKMAAWMLLGGIRTYTHMGDREFNYEAWMQAVRDGNTFVTVGPLVEFQVNGQVAGSRIDLPAGGGTLDVSWKIESLRMPVARVEVISGGETVADRAVDGALASSGSASVTVEKSGWLALRVRGTYQNNPDDVAAHTSTVQVLVDRQPVYSLQDAVAVLTQIEGSLAFVDTLATRGEAEQYQRLRLKLETAWNRLHQRMHREGVYHKHTPVHDHSEHHEH